jgi:hypothetical protein
LIAESREAFNASFSPEKYSALLQKLDARCGAKVEFRVAETPVFLPKRMMEGIADAGERLAKRLMDWPEYLAGARNSIPEGYLVAGETAHPNFLTADFALVQGANGEFLPRLVEIQAFPSVFAYQVALNQTYAEVFDLSASPGMFLSGLTEEGFWDLFRRTVVGNHAPENVVLTEVDPYHQKTLPDFLQTREKLGISVVDIASLLPIGNKLHYRNTKRELVPIHRIYNRAIADEMIARMVELPFTLSDPWDVEWAGHPNWYFLISKYAVPWLAQDVEGLGEARKVVPPAVFLEDFLEGRGFVRLRKAGVDLAVGDDAVYENLLLKPLFSFAGKGIQFAPSRAELLAIPERERGNFLLQQRMHFVPTIATPHGMTQAEIRILYLWPDRGSLTPVLSLVRLGRGKMMGVDHNRNQEWVGASGAFWPEG